MQWLVSAVGRLPLAVVPASRWGRPQMDWAAVRPVVVAAGRQAQLRAVQILVERRFAAEAVAAAAARCPLG